MIRHRCIGWGIAVGIRKVRCQRLVCFVDVVAQEGLLRPWAAFFYLMRWWGRWCVWFRCVLGGFGMSAVDLFVVAPVAWCPTVGGGVVESTPFGDVALRRCVVGGGAMVWVEATISPFAAMYAARWIGAQFVVGLVPAVALNGLLVSGDLLVPDDVVDFTQLPRYTFFAGRGYGFLAQREPFCPLLRGALVAAARSGYPRTFARGMLAAADGQVAVGALGAEADVVGAGVVPMCFLARELELCYAPLCVVGDAAVSGEPVTQVRADVVGALVEVVAGLPGVRGCGCATAMQVYRDRGDVGADWRAWIGDV